MSRVQWFIIHGLFFICFGLCVYCVPLCVPLASVKFEYKGRNSNLDTPGGIHT